LSGDSLQPSPDCYGRLNIQREFEPLIQQHQVYPNNGLRGNYQQPRQPIEQTGLANGRDNKRQRFVHTYSCLVGRMNDSMTQLTEL